ncbi:transporter substrate-binding domain-containing protein [Desulfobacterales bacterium HSG16]|nr:transporter substrate-binding domain-containing protein [Desulfobacterales bacterium HSG16]
MTISRLFSFLLLMLWTTLFWGYATTSVLSHNKKTTDTENGLDKEKTLVIAIFTGYEPFFFINAEGQPVGLFVDIWKLWGWKANRKIRFLPSGWSQTLTNLKEGRADIHSGLFYSESRSEWMAFSDSFYDISSLFFHTIDQTLPVESDDFVGLPLGTLSNSFQEEFLINQYPKAKIIGFDHPGNVVRALLNGEIRAFLSESVPTAATLTRQGLLGNISCSDNVLFRNRVHASVLKGRLKLLDLIDEGLEKISDEELMEIESRWVPDPAKRIFKSKMLRLAQHEKDWLRTHHTIRVSGPRAFPPFHYYNDTGSVQGMTSDYVRLISQRLGINMIFQEELSWTDVLGKMKNGEIDAISCAAKTAERKKYMHFSEPYLSFPMVIVSRKDADFIGGIKDLAGKKVACIPSEVTCEWLKRDGIDIVPCYFGSPLKGLEVVSTGQADAHVGNLAALSYLIEKNGLTNLKVAAPTEYGNYKLYFTVRKDWPEFVDIINKVLASITEEEHNMIRQKWLSVRFEHGITSADVWKWIMRVTGLSILLIGITLFWNARLKKEIKEREKAEEALREAKNEVDQANLVLETRVVEELGKRHRQEQLLIQKSKLESLGRLAAGIAHEINQPLAGIAMGIENTLLKTLNNRLDRDYLTEECRLLLQDVDRIRSIIEHVRIFSREQQSEQTEDILIDKAIENTLLMVQAQCEQHDIRILSDIGRITGTIVGNEYRLEQVILNLIGNARDALEEKYADALDESVQKEIRIRTWEEPELIFIEIKDNGIGISDENLEKLFEPFYTTKNPGKGTGLGLSISYGIIEEMNGEIMVQSRINEYTRITISFPKKNREKQREKDGTHASV